MNTGLLISPTSKAARHAALHKVVTTHTSHTWAALLVKMLLSQINGQTTARGTPYLPRELLKDKYDGAGKRLFLFDYDVRAVPSIRFGSRARMRRVLMTVMFCLGYPYAHRQDTVDGGSFVGCAQRARKAHRRSSQRRLHRLWSRPSLFGATPRTHQTPRYERRARWIHP